jgi:hypothetical protein
VIDLRAACLRAWYCAHPLLLSRIFSKSLVSVKIRAADTIKAIAAKAGAFHLEMALTAESSWSSGG